MNKINWDEMLETFYEYSLKLPEGCDYISRQFRDGEINLALQSIEDFSEGIIWMLKTKEYADLNNFEFPLDIGIVKDIMTNISKAIEQKEFNDVADLFEYEMKDLFENLNRN